MKKDTDNPWQTVGLVGTLGLEILAFILGGVFLGRYMDDQFDTAPMWLAIGILAGLILGLISAVFTLKTFMKE
ncbi:F0F1-type ATP synthase assembly protein I [Pullulanibacillus pueri]|uniref:AtpZ/AtpI family protein n=1 Tax=Pullulanibacillus pueri TaxID=1437324 RepID=A0A8J3EM94_9BACL|nr:AtpZ/AtpI family protein [Pullulanibacillus pueri]MBM7681728.1 F0F1-type ATP synthase assembly protein I [Pullulanibacillus pueri]GGH84069.1 hypothetical protein GCM10007096_26290 [Pullulanibacillus pueri]